MVSRTASITLGILLSASGFAATASFGSVAHAADYAARGPVAFTESALPSAPIGGRIVVPNASGRYPLIIASHGFAANPTNQIGWARHFASYGFVVAVPDLGLLPDHNQNPTRIANLVARLKDPSFASPAQGKVDPDRIGLEGHSAGGLATSGASRAIKANATVLFDPVDANNLGRANMQGICAPILAIYAAPGGCNSNGNWGPFKTASTGPLVSFTLRNSTHCDGENEARGACGGFCGGAATPARQSQLARYATAFFLAHLKNDSEAFAILEESALRANGEVTDLVVRGGSNCAPVPGPGGDDAGALDAGVTDGGEGDAGGSDAGLDASPDATVQDGGDGGGSGEGGADADAGGVLDAGVDASDASLADATTPRRDAGRDAADGDDDDDGDDLDDGPKPNPRPTDAGDGVGDDGSGGDGCSCVTAGKQASGSDVALLALGILGCVGLWRRRATKTP